MGERARPLRFAHRGDWRVAPENSLEAMLAAMRVPGCDGVEFDVRLSRDGVPVLLHDETLTRVQGRPERIDELSAADLQAAGIPALATVLSALPQDAFLDVELKGDVHGEPTAAVLRDARGATPANAIVSSFDEAALVAMAERLPGWPRWLNAEDLSPETIALAGRLGCTAISARWETITPATINDARAAGVEVAAWTVRSPSLFDDLAALGVIGCCVEAEALDGAGAR